MDCLSLSAKLYNRQPKGFVGSIVTKWHLIKITLFRLLSTQTIFLCCWIYHHICCLTPVVVNRICPLPFRPGNELCTEYHSPSSFWGSTELCTREVMLFLCNSLACCTDGLFLLLNSVLHLPAVSQHLHLECCVLLCTSYAQIIP